MVAERGASAARGGDLWGRLAELCPDPLVVLDADKRIETLNVAAARLFGYPLPEALGLPFDSLAAARPGQMAGAGVLEGTRRDGTHFPLEANFRPGGEGPDQHVIVTIRESASRVDAAPTVRTTEAQLAEAQQVARIGSWEWDIGTNQITWSDELYRLYGLEPGSVNVDFDHFLGLLPEHERQRVGSIVGQAHATGESFVFDHEVVRPDGTKAILQGRGDVIKGADGKPIRMVGTSQDVTEARKAEKALRQSLQEKEVLLKEVHHRVKNNMQIIASLLNLQASHIEDPKARTAFLESRQRIKSMALIHEKLYETTTIARVDPADYLGALTRDVLRSYGTSAAQIQLDVRAENVLVPIDAVVNLGLIASELVSNCLKHAFPDDRKGHIGVTLRSDGNKKAVLSVVDDGVGFPPGSDALSSPGLGLQLVTTLVEQLSGTMRVESAGGTAVHVTLSLVPPGGDQTP